MSTIKLTKTLAKIIKEYDSGTYEENINKLLDDVGDELKEQQRYCGITTIGVSAETKERIKSFQKKHNEPYEEVLVRALQLTQ